MAGYVGKTARQRELEKLYNKLCGRYSRYEVWQDMVWMVATAISNAVDSRYYEQREANYLRIAQKYSEDELKVFPEFFNQIVMGMEETPDCDFLGELYMNLELGNKHTGQFFTPYSLCRMMARCDIQKDMLDAEMARQGYISVNDCACGAGATLVAAANCLREIGFDYQRNALFVAQDIDSTTALMCYIQLSLLGCAGYVVIGDTLTEPQRGQVLFGEDSDRCWFTPMFFEETWHRRRVIERERRRFMHIMNVLNGTGKRNDDQKPTPEASADDREPEAGFTISAKKKNIGQIMFDFGGVRD